MVLDPFCGCGTAIAAAERLNRRWIGIDVTHIAITLIRHRLHDTFKGQHSDDLKPYEVIGQPQDVASAQALATDSENSGRYQFEWWALGLVDAPPGPGPQERAQTPASTATSTSSTTTAARPGASSSRSRAAT